MAMGKRNWRGKAAERAAGVGTVVPKTGTLERPGGANQQRNAVWLNMATGMLTWAEGKGSDCCVLARSVRYGQWYLVRAIIDFRVGKVDVYLAQPGPIWPRWELRAKGANLHPRDASLFQRPRDLNNFALHTSSIPTVAVFDDVRLAEGRIEPP